MSPDQERSARLSSLLREEIRKAGGAIPFGAFMRRSLYEPGLGYYEHDRVGRDGDFYTSVSVGPLFGELIALDALGRFEALDRRARSDADGGDPDAGAFVADSTHPVSWIEVGAHDGRFAADFLGWFRDHRPDWFRRIRYRIIEPSTVRRSWQRETLAAFLDQVEWIGEVQGFEGILFGNELLDAFPVERLGWDRSSGRWFQWGVREDGDGFGWCRLTSPRVEGTPVADLPPDLLEVLPDGYTIEHSPEAEAWWRMVAGRLLRGWLMMFDYGFEASDRFRPERLRGTLRGYREHRHAENLLEAPGLTDLTAHVDFGRIAGAGEGVGLETETLETQGRYLGRVMQVALERRAGFGEWTPARVRQFQTLTHPQHLGQSFRVLVQGR